MECGGKCCSFKTLNISFRSFDEADNLEDVLNDLHTEQLVFTDGDVPNMKWYLVEKRGKQFLLFDCQHLTEDGKCGEYERRPALCSEFECMVLRGETELDDFLESAAPLDYDEDELIDVTEEVQQAIREQEN